MGSDANATTVFERQKLFIGECEYLESVWREKLVLLYPALDDFVTSMQTGKFLSIDALNLSAEQLYQLSHAISTLFQLWNLAEDRHRLRRILIHRSVDSRPESGTIAAWREQSNLSDPEIRNTLANIDLRIVFTAHPTEVRRKSVMRHLQNISRAMTEREQSSERYRLIPEHRISSMIATLLQTGDIRSEVVTPIDEMRDLELQLPMMWETLSVFRRSAIAALGEANDSFEPSRLPQIRFGCWVGVDADGNPNITPATMWYAAITLRKLAFTHLTDELEHLAEDATSSLGLAVFPEQLFAFESDLAGRAPLSTSKLGNRYRREPIRRILEIILERLKLSSEEIQLNPNNRWQYAPTPNEEQYRSPDELDHDLKTIAELCFPLESGLSEALTQFRYNLRQFGFHFATLEHRLHANDIMNCFRKVLATPDAPDQEIRQIIGDWYRTSVSPKVDWDLLANDPIVLRLIALSEIRLTFGPEALDTIIISGTEQSEELFGLTILLDHFTSKANSLPPIRISPLFETTKDLSSAPTILDKMFAEPHWRDRLTKLDNTQDVMLGYSDSGKDGGIVAATLALDSAARRIQAVGSKNNLAVRLFHGRGGSIARGGGPLYQAIVSSPASVGTGTWKLTEQGEMIATRYTHPILAARVLERLVAGTAVALTATQVPEPPEEITSEFAREAEKRWRELVYRNDDFPAFFAAISPVNELQALRIGSRPAKRQNSSRIEDFRAIPWVFGWQQNRLLLPAWFGFGTAAKFTAKNPELWNIVKHQFQTHPLLQSLVTKLTITTALVDFQAAESFYQLDQNENERLQHELKDEYEETLRFLVELNTADPLVRLPLFQTSLTMRAYHLRALALIEAELLRRLRFQTDESVEAFVQMGLLQTIIAVAAGMRNTG